MAHPKGLLIERAQRLGLARPEFETAQTGPEHEPSFLSDVTIDGELLGTGQGGSKRDAERRAAEEALAALDKRETAAGGKGAKAEKAQPAAKAQGAKGASKAATAKAASGAKAATGALAPAGARAATGGKTAAGARAAAGSASAEPAAEAAPGAPMSPEDATEEHTKGKKGRRGGRGAAQQAEAAATPAAPAAALVADADEAEEQDEDEGRAGTLEGEAAEDAPFAGPWPMIDDVLASVVTVAERRVSADLRGDAALVAIRDFALRLYKDLLADLGEVVEEDEEEEEEED